MNLPQYAQKYLAKQDNKKWKIERANNKLFNNIIVIPALNEFVGIQNLLPSLAQNSQKHLDDTLILIVINNLTDEDSEKIEDNLKLLQYLKSEIKNPNLNIGIVDVSTDGKEMPQKHGGVGFARKLGIDLALSCFDYSSAEKKIIISLDSDCTVSSNYIESIITKFNKNNLHAAVVKFEHPLIGEEQAAIINYEIFLRYYVLGLLYAKSHYAYFSVGSVIICDVESYIKVGGMNKRKAGEDFYFLEKLAKLDKINKIEDATVFPSSRSSDRVPFGTGASIKRILDNVRDEYILYNPVVFEIIKSWLEIYSSINLSVNVGQILNEAREINNHLYLFLIQQNFENDWINIIKNTKSEIQLEKQKLNWMDSFRTLKLIHFLRDNEIPNQNMFISLNQLFKKMNVILDFKSEQQLPPLHIQQKYLEILRKLT